MPRTPVLLGHQRLFAASPTADVRNRVLYLALRAAARLLPIVPLGWAYRVGEAAAVLAYYLVPDARRGLLSNLAVAFPDRSAEARERFARAAFRNNAKNWLDTLRIASLRSEEIIRSVDVEGWENLEQAVALGRGVILVSMHLGNFDLVGQLLAAHGLQVTVPVQRVEPPALFDFLTAQRESKGIDTVPLERAPRAMLRALSRGEIAAMTTDRLLAGKGLPIDFFGRSVILPRGAPTLARLSGAPIVFGLGIRGDRGGFHAHVEAAMSSDQNREAHEDEYILLGQLVVLMEAAIRRYPEQWIAFSPVWDSRSDTDSTATIEQQS